jgi:DNA-directed RNA polymerase specialized sigma subunit
LCLNDLDLRDLAALDLTEIEVRVLAMTFFDRMGLRRVSREIDISRTHTRRILQRAAAKVQSVGYTLPPRPESKR